MKIELLTVGTELLLGFTIDTNGAEIARSLASIGVEIVRRTSVGDDRTAIQDAVGAALDRTGVASSPAGSAQRGMTSPSTPCPLLDAPSSSTRRSGGSWSSVSEPGWSQP
jgi:nicotinamide-nucleotide amidase